MQKLMSTAIGLMFLGLILLVGCSTPKTTSQFTKQDSRPPISQTSAPVTQVSTSTQQGIDQANSHGWVPIMNGNNSVIDNNKNQFFWHPPTLQRQGNQVTYLVLTILNTLDNAKPKFVFGQMTANCQTQSFHAISGTIYNASGELINAVSSTPEEIAKPGSINEIVLMNVCKAHPQLTEADLTRIQLDQLAQARQTNADLLNRAGQSTVNLFR